MVKVERFQGTYLQEIIELLNDEEAYIRIEALETLTELLEYLEPTLIEKEFLHAFIDMIDIGIEDLILRLANILGKIVHGLKQFDMHKLHIEKILEFYREICNHKDLEMRKEGAYNLACFNLYYKED
jgi:hypothetical protein